MLEWSNRKNECEGRKGYIFLTPNTLWWLVLLYFPFLKNNKSTCVLRITHWYVTAKFLPWTKWYYQLLLICTPFLSLPLSVSIPTHLNITIISSFSFHSKWNRWRKQLFDIVSKGMRQEETRREAWNFFSQLIQSQ